MTAIWLAIPFAMQLTIETVKADLEDTMSNENLIHTNTSKPNVVNNAVEALIRDINSGKTILWLNTEDGSQNKNIWSKQCNDNPQGYIDNYDCTQQTSYWKSKVQIKNSTVYWNTWISIWK